MQRVKFTLENLKQLDMGKVPAAFNLEMQRAVLDCNDRPADKKARRVVIEVYVAPVPDVGGGIDSVNVECEVYSRIPKRRTRGYSMKPTVTGELAFHPDLPDDPEGNALFDPDTGEVKDE